MSDDTTNYERALNHIGEISKNARSSWFGMLGALVFATLAVSNVKDSDFFAFGVETTLPLVNVDVPTVPFFWTAPVLVFAIYVYLHLYLTNLWHALGKLPTELMVKGEKIRAEDAVYPWILSDAALYLKPNSERRFLSWLKLVASFFLVWVAGPVVLGLFWARSWPYHHEWLSLFLALNMLCAILLGVNTFFDAVKSLAGTGFTRITLTLQSGRISGLMKIMFWTIIGALISIVSWNKTEGPLAGFKITDLHSADLRGVDLIPRPSGWTPWDVAMNELLADYGGENQSQLRSLDEAARNGYGELDWFPTAKGEFITRRRSLIGSIGRTNLTGADLRNADLSGAFISGADLSNSRIGGATFDGAEMEGAILHGVDTIEGGCPITGPSCTSFASANLAWARLESESFKNIDFGSANLSFAKMSGDFEGSNFSFSNMEGVAVTNAGFRYTVFWGTDLFDANPLYESDFTGAIFAGADLRKARFVGPQEHVEFDPDTAILEGASIISSNLRGATLPSVDVLESLRGTNLGNVSLWSWYLELDSLTDTNLSDLDLSNVEVDRGGLIWALGNETTKLPPANPPIKILKCFAGVAPESYYYYQTAFLPIAPSLFSEDQFCSGDFGSISPDQIIYGPRLNPHEG